MKCGIIGLPNVGKSSLFNCLSALSAPAENYPFCTVDPNIGTVPVPDPRLDTLARVFQSQKVTPSVIEFVDIAGLIPGAHKGEGLGNRFLSHIREATALVHVLRTFTDNNIVHTQGEVDPIRDIQLIETELILADLELLQKRQNKLQKGAKGLNSKELKAEQALLDKLINWLSKEQLASSYVLEKEDKLYFQNWNLLTAKPVLYVCNTDEDLTTAQKWIQAVKDKCGTNSVLAISARLEAEIALLKSEKEKQEFLSALGWQETGLNRLIRRSYQLLNLITFFTAGPKETRAYPLQKGQLAPFAAGKIHSDFQKGFISAEVYSFEDLKNKGSERALKEAGQYRQEGKNYLVQDGDVILFRFNV